MGLLQTTANTGACDEQLLLQAARAGELPEGLSLVEGAKSNRTVHLDDPYNVGAAAQYVVQQALKEKAIAEAAGKKFVLILGEGHATPWTLALQTMVIEALADIDRQNGLQEPSFIVANEAPAHLLDEFYPRIAKDDQLHLFSALQFFQDNAPLTKAVRMQAIINSDATYTHVEANKISLPTEISITPSDKDYQKLSQFFAGHALPVHQNWHIKETEGVHMRNAYMVWKTHAGMEGAKKRSAVVLTGVAHTLGKKCPPDTPLEDQRWCNCPYEQSLPALFNQAGVHSLTVSFAYPEWGETDHEGDPIIFENLDLDRYKARSTLHPEQAYLEKLANHSTGHLPFPQIPERLFDYQKYWEVHTRSEQSAIDNGGRLPPEAKAKLDALYAPAAP